MGGRQNQGHAQQRLLCTVRDDNTGHVDCVPMGVHHGDSDRAEPGWSHGYRSDAVLGWPLLGKSMEFYRIHKVYSAGERGAESAHVSGIRFALRGHPQSKFGVWKPQPGAASRFLILTVV